MKVLLFACCLLFARFVSGQQDKQFTHYMFDLISFNPATTGFKGYSGTLIYRNQWDRVDNAPNTTLLNVQGNLQNVQSGPGKLGVGMALVNDVIGFQRTNTFALNGAYHTQTHFGKFSVGIGLGLVNVGYNPSWIPPQIAVELDPVLAPINEQSSATTFDSNAGLFWYGNSGYYVGISATHLVPQYLSKLNYEVARHYYLQAGGKYEIGQKHFNQANPVYLQPGILVKTEGATAVVDVNLRVDVGLSAKTYLWGGITYRYSDAIGLMVGLSKNTFKVGYSYDIITNPLNEYGKGSHELMFSYGIFPKKRPVTSHGNPMILQ